MSVISVNNVSKTIKSKTILKNINFHIETGECVALIGPNGAGKTTLMKCLLGDLFVTTGTVSIQNMPVTHPTLKLKVNVLTQENNIPTQLKVNELIQFFHRIYPNPLSMEQIYNLLQFSDEQKNQFASKLSGGQKRLLSFVLTIIGKPDILFLDEPTASMDTQTRKRFWDIVTQLKESGVTIFYSSHYIEEVEHTADRVLVLHKGELIRDTTPFLMRQQEFEKIFTLPVTLKSVVEQLSDITQIVEDADTIKFSTKQANTVWQHLQRYCTIEDIEVTNKTLLDVLFDSTKEEDK